MQTKLQKYLDFLRNKVQLSTGGGLPALDMHPSLFYHQQDIVRWALQRGKALIAAKFMLMPPQAPEEYEETVWTDILFMRTLNMAQSRRRQEKHICPLPLDIVERLIVRYSNPDELIYDPFGGLHTVPFMAIKLGRRGLGCELNPLYWQNGVKYCQDAELARSAPSLFAGTTETADAYEVEVAA